LSDENKQASGSNRLGPEASEEKPTLANEESPARRVYRELAQRDPRFKIVKSEGRGFIIGGVRKKPE